MLGLATGAELRLAAYGVLLAAICASYIYTHHEGFEACKAPQVAAQKAQVEKDLADAKGTINELRAALAAVPTAQPPPVVRLCPSTSRVREAAATTGAKPDLVGSFGESAVGVPQGTLGIDIGGELQNVERAAEVVAIYRDTTYEWALKQSQH